MKWLCDDCTYSGSDCPYPQENHCEYYTGASKRAYHYRERRPTPYERTRAQVYATGNKWAIENFNATH